MKKKDAKKKAIQKAAERTIEDRAKEFWKYVKTVMARKPSWTQAQNALFSPEGPTKIGELFPTREDRESFMKTAVYERIQDYLSSLHDDASKPAFLPGDRDVTRIHNVNGQIVLRLPKSVHAELLREADEEGVPLNDLILTKLVRDKRR